MEEHAADHGIVPRRPSDVDFCVPGNVPLLYRRQQSFLPRHRRTLRV